MNCIQSGRQPPIGRGGEPGALLSPRLRGGSGWGFPRHSRPVSPTRPRYARPPSPKTGREKEGKPMSDDFLKNPASLFDIRGKTAIVTGASGAFGSLAAKVLSGAGANVVLAASKVEELKKVAAECEALGGKTEVVAKRPSSEANCDEIVAAAVAKFGRLDILVVASGLNKVSKIVDQKPADFLEVMDANVTQSWLVARAAARQMLKQGQGGKIILTSSARGLLGHPAGYTAYCASKSAVDGITKALGCELGETGITVNALGPTVFRSP